MIGFSIVKNKPMFRIVLGLLFTFFLILLSSVYAATPGQTLLQSGKGTATKPYIIKNASDWNFVATNPAFASKHFKLGANIRAQKLKAWNWGTKPFSGSLNGDGKKIISCTFIENPYQKIKGRKVTEYYSGSVAITYLKKATIKNISFVDCRFSSKAKATHSKAAASPFFIVNKSVLKNITVSRSKLKSIHATKSGAVAGLAHTIKNSKVSDCIVKNSTITSGANSAAGIAIVASNSTFTRVASVSNTITSKAKTSNKYSAGLICFASTKSIISRSKASYNTVSSPTQAAGLIATATSSDISECYVRAGQVRATGKTAKRAAGFYLFGNSSSITNSYVSQTAVTAKDADAFGFGESLSSGSVSNCYSDTLLSGALDRCYPFMRNNNATTSLAHITNCFATYRDGYNSVTGGATILAPWQLNVSFGAILGLSKGAGANRWNFSPTTYPHLVRNP